MTVELAVPLAPEDRARHFQEALSYRAEMESLSRSARRAGWIIGGAGFALGLLGLGTALAMLPLKQVIPLYFEVDSRSTGAVVQATTAIDAPKLFGEATAEQYLRLYAEFCVSYHYQTRTLMFDRCALLSTPARQEEFHRMVDPRNPESPMTVFGQDGTVELSNFRFAHFGEQGKTQLYRVFFTRVENRGGSVRKRPWAMTVQFQWHPEYPMGANDRQINAAGFQALSATSDPDGPDLP